MVVVVVVVVKVIVVVVMVVEVIVVVRQWARQSQVGSEKTKYKFLYIKKGVRLLSWG